MDSSGRHFHLEKKAKKHDTILVVLPGDTFGIYIESETGFDLRLGRGVS